MPGIFFGLAGLGLTSSLISGRHCTNGSRGDQTSASERESRPVAALEAKSHSQQRSGLGLSLIVID